MSCYMRRHKKCWRCGDLYHHLQDNCPECLRSDAEEFSRQERYREERRRLRDALSRLEPPFSVEGCRDI